MQASGANTNGLLKTSCTVQEKLDQVEAAVLAAVNNTQSS